MGANFTGGHWRELSNAFKARIDAILLIWDSAVTLAVETIVELDGKFLQGAVTVASARSRAYQAMTSDKNLGAAGAFAIMGIHSTYMHEDHIPMQGSWREMQTSQVRAAVISPIAGHAHSQVQLKVRERCRSTCRFQHARTRHPPATASSYCVDVLENAVFI